MLENRNHFIFQIRIFRYLSAILGTVLLLTIVATQWQGSLWVNWDRAISVTFCLYPMFLALQLAFVRAITSMMGWRIYREAVFFLLATGLLVGVCVAQTPAELGVLTGSAAALTPIGLYWMGGEYRRLIDIRESGTKGR